jgi:AAA15 family ATPase/GTPase
VELRVPMLIRFAVENHLSIRERQELSLVASPLKDKGADLIDTVYEGVHFLPAALLYGGNASGKSNFISAINYVKYLVRFSHERGRPEGGIPRSPFLLDEDSRKAPSTFDLEFIVGGTRFNYGFSVNNISFSGEWLYAFPSRKKQTWYIRDDDRKHIYFGKQLRGASKVIESLTRSNSLFLSVAAQNAHKQLMPIYTFFQNIHFNSGTENSAGDAFTTFARGEIDRRIVSFLAHADIGIVDYKFEDRLSDSDSSAIINEIFDVLKKHYNSSDLNFNVNDLAIKQISLGHRTEEGSHRFLELRMESSGTLRLLILLKNIFVALDQGSVAIIDELDASLHTLLSERIITLFNSKKMNPRGAQLIATTHDTNLLRGNVLRRDQIWFVEKNKNGATVIYPLTDIKTRNSDNIEKGYLQGRFGAIPFGSPIENLIDPRS